MSTIQFNGIVTIPLPWKSSIITASGGSPPPATFNNPQNSFAISPDSTVIKWDSNVPLSFQGLSVNTLATSDIISGTNFSINRNIVNTVTSGLQESEDFGKPLLHLYFLDSNSEIRDYDIESLQWNNQPCLSGFGPSENGYSYPFNNKNPSGNLVLTSVGAGDSGNFSKLTFIEVSPWNQCGQCSNVVNPACENRNVTNFTMTMVMNVSVIIPCQTGSDLQTQFCLNYCNQPDNQSLCYPQYRQFCLVESGSDGNINLFTNESCDTFIKQYLSTQGPQADVDNLINGACAQFTDVDEFNAQDTTVRDICACHLPQDIYDNLRNTLIQEFPGFQYVDENERCLFPQCPSSSYKISVPIGRTCALPQCINIASINNNGTIKGGAQIDQDSRCQSAKNQTGNNAGQPVEETKSWLEKHWVWLVLGLGVLVVLIIVILIILASEGNKKKPKKL